MARRYDRIGAAFRWVYEDAVRQAPPAPDLQRVLNAPPPRMAPSARPFAAGLAALVVIVSVGAAALLFGGESLPTGEDTTVPSPTTTAPEAAETTAVPATEAPATTSPTEPGVLLRSAPWASGEFESDQADPVALEAWNRAGNRRWCSLLVPAEPGAETTARAADFGSGSWAVAWDNPSGPGMRGNSTPCENCGRSAFGVAGVDLVAEGNEPEGWPHQVGWADGSAAGYGNEGGADDAEFVDPETGNQVPPRQLGEVVIVGQACLYQVWSSLGETHLESLLEQLRFIVGYQAEPVEVRRPGDPPAVTTEGGRAPWAGDRLASSQVPPVLLRQWQESGSATPLVVIEGLEEELATATIRSAAAGEWGVAWDNPEGPGHDAFNLPCADCGRGVVGLSGRTGSLSEAEGTSYGRIDWEDGSVALYDLYLGSQGLPVERVMYTDPVTGAEVPDGWQAQVEIAGTDSVFTVWTHLGEQHLLDLLGRLRLVDVD